MIPRDYYLNQLKQAEGNGLIKVITGIRRCGKSVLLNELFVEHLIEAGIPSDHIIKVDLDDIFNKRLRNPILLAEHIRSLMGDEQTYFILLDEIQNCVPVPNPDAPGNQITFIDALLGLRNLKNADVYVTGSNSRMLSTDLLTQFRGKGDEIRVHPLRFFEFYPSSNLSKSEAYDLYSVYGGMPGVFALPNVERKVALLKNLYNKIYYSDILERYGLNNKAPYVLESLAKIIASSVGSMMNPSKYQKLFLDRLQINVSFERIANYIDYFCDSFLIQKAERYDIKGKRYIASPYKYYFEDIGLRNALLNFRQNEPSRAMENIIYNELVARGYNVDVGVVEYFEKEDGKTVRKSNEIDFVANLGSRRYYIQSAFAIETEEKQSQEKSGFDRINDSFPKIIIERYVPVSWHDEKGVLHLGIEEFLLNENSLDL